MGKLQNSLLIVLLCVTGCVPSTATPVPEGSPPPIEGKTQTKTPEPVATLAVPPTISPSPIPTQTPTPFLIQTLPENCEAAGLGEYQQASSTGANPDLVQLERGRILIVNSNSDEVNGVITDVDALLETPGSDGISLREVLLAVNNDPGEYTVRFAPALQGTEILVGSWDRTELPPLTSGSLIINGDIDGDGSPDITLKNGTGPVPNGSNFIGFVIRSSHNTLHALRMVGFGDSILFDAPGTQQIYQDNILSHLQIDSILGGVNLYSGRSGGDETARETNNAWVDMLIIGNTIHAMSGIGIGLHRSSGDRIENMTIVDNTIVVAPLDGRIAFAISLAAGFWMSEQGNTIRNVVIENNYIEGDMEAGLYLASGSVGASENLIENVRVSNNHIHVTRPVAENGAPRDAVVLTTGDGASSYINASFQPVVYPEDNEIRDIWFIGNLIEGQGGQGVVISSGCCGAQKNWIHNVFLIENEIRGVFPGSGMTNSGAYILGGGSGPGDVQITAENRVSEVFIQHNLIELINQRESFGGQELVSGGIAVAAGAQSTKNSVQNVWIVSNQITSPITGISLTGGWSQTPGFVSSENTLHGVHVWCNEVNANLSLFQPIFPEVKGINLTGGYGPSSANRLSDISLEKNLVSGILDDVSVFINVGNESTDNVVDDSP